MIEILYEDKHIAVFVKPVGVLSAPTESESESVFSLLSEQCGRKELYLVHRLDRNVGGVMLMAKTKAAAGKFSALVAERSFGKEYLAIVHGKPNDDCGIYRDLLFKDSSSNKTFVTDRMRKGVKEASLEYRLLKSVNSEDGVLSLVRIKLHTGRTHQIRAQFSSRQMPLFGDGKYGSHTNCGFIGLFSARLCFEHPFRCKKEIDIRSLPQTSNYPWNLFEDVLSKDIFDCSIISGEIL